MSQEQTNSAGMSQLQRLKALQEENKAKSQKTNMTAFNELVGIYVGTPTRPHYPKLRDENGKVIKDEKGRDKRSDENDGYTHVFAEFGTAKMIQIVLPKEYNLNITSAYALSGLGYDIASSNMFFIEKDGTIANYQEGNKMVKEFDIDSFIDDFLENVKELEEDDDYPIMMVNKIWF